MFILIEKKDFIKLLFCRLSRKLKGLFTLFAGHIIQHASNILNQLNLSKTEEVSTEFKINFRKKFAEENKIELINGILGTISNLCLFDSVGFINEERFQLLMMPIVDQVFFLNSLLLLLKVILCFDFLVRKLYFK